MRDNQTHIEVTVTQGEDVDPKYVNTIATYKFELPPDRSAGRPVKVTYSYDANQCMQCKFEDIESGRILEVDFAMNREGDIQTNDSPEETSQVESAEVQ
jgi:molecular chaperone DnaK